MTANVSDNEQDIDFMKIEWFRGKTPKDIKQKCLQLCKHYLAGIWLNLTLDEVKIRRITGGLTNQLYHFAINDENKSVDAKQPEEVVIQLYQGKRFNNFDDKINERFNDTIIALKVSENGLGPKIYGLFESGQIQAFYEHKQFRCDQQKDPKLVRKVATKLARVHAMDVSIKKTGNWIFETFDDFYKTAENLFDLKTLFSETNSITLKTNCLSEELEWLKKVVIECDSPINFTHVDFRGSNIMITKSNDIVLCDFEYACYGYRGADFGSIFHEWGRPFHDLVNRSQFADDNTLKPFIDTYIEESIELKGDLFRDDKRNSFSHILKEGKVFALVSLMFYVLITLQSNESFIEDIPYDKKKAMAFTELSYYNYHYLKQQFMDQKIF